MRFGLIVFWLLFWSAGSAMAQVSIGVGLPGVSIGINLPVYPALVRVPGYPVYYAPRLDANFFFYDGMYWVYEDDGWYSSTWYNGPWNRIGPEFVPLYVLRIPVRYYRAPPAHFRGWQASSPPRWGEHWGNDWAQRRHGWDNWNRRSSPAPAPLPVYQKKYGQDRYPHQEQQRAIQQRNYGYQPRDNLVRQQRSRDNAAPPPSRHEVQDNRQERSNRQAPAMSRPHSEPAPQRAAPDLQRSPPSRRESDQPHNSAPAQSRSSGPGFQDQRSSPRQEVAPREQPRPQSGQENMQRGNGPSPEAGRGRGQEKDRESGEGRGHGQDRNR